jgi:uncharacterized membrane protein (DUF485 family)
MADPTPDYAENVPRRRFEREEQPVDWIAAERSPEFRELIARKRRFVVPATIFFLGWYLGFIALAGYAPDFMGESIYQGFTVGYALALSQFVMTWVLGWMYVRRADNEFDDLAAKAAARAIEVGRTGDARPTDGGTTQPGRTATERIAGVTRR